MSALLSALRPFGTIWFRVFMRVGGARGAVGPSRDTRVADAPFTCKKN